MKNTPRSTPSRAATPLIPVLLLLLATLAPAPSMAVTYVHQTPLQFTWDEASGEVDHYNVYVSVDGQPYEMLAEAASNAFQLSVLDGKSYQVQVDAEDAEGLTGPVSDCSDPVVVFLNGSAADIDGDGMPNEWEELYGLDPVDPADAVLDPDGDGLGNAGEYAAGSLPGNADTDGDGVNDGQEVGLGLDPTDPSDNVPVARAGADQEVDPTLVTLDGSASVDPNGDALTYLWTQQDGAQVALSDPTSARPAFLGRLHDVYRFRLVVSDGVRSSLPDDVTVTVRNVAPTADAGQDRVVESGTEVVLDGCGSSDPNGDTLSYAWSQAAGPAVSLSGAAARAASFVPEDAGVYIFQLVVHDGLTASAADEVEVVVNAANRVPTADAGDDQTRSVGEQVTLDGSGSSDPDGDALTFVWTQTAGPCTVAIEGAGTAHASFVPAVAGSYRLALTVHDGEVASPADPVSVTVLDENEPPVAVVLDPGPGVVGQWVSLNGGGSYDPEGEPLTCLWTQLEGPQAALGDARALLTGFYPTVEGTLRFQLVVDDGESASAPAEVVVVVNGANQVPVAEAGENQDGLTGRQICLDGSGSYDPDPQDVLAFSWTQVGGPLTALEGAGSATPCFTPVSSGVYTFGLSVSDGELESPTDQVVVTVALRENQAPVAVAGNDRAVLPGTEVVLDGSGSFDLDGEIVRYVWTQTHSSCGTLLLTEPAEGMTVTVVPEELGYNVFSLEVFDGELWSTASQVVVWVTNSPPPNCSMVAGASSRPVNRSDVLFVATLFLPALCTLGVRRACRGRRVTRTPGPRGWTRGCRCS